MRMEGIVPIISGPEAPFIIVDPLQEALLVQSMPHKKNCNDLSGLTLTL